jgi:hypothetical protein
VFCLGFPGVLVAWGPCSVQEGCCSWRQRCTSRDEPWERRDLLGVHKQKQEGLNWVGVSVPSGRLQAEDMEVSAGLRGFRDSGWGWWVPKCWIVEWCCSCLLRECCGFGGVRGWPEANSCTRLSSAGM